MAEKQTEAVSQEAEKVVSSKSSREPFFGTLLFVLMLIVLATCAALLGWWGYRGFQANKEQAALPSISTLATKEEVKEPEEAKEETVSPQKTDTVSPEELLKKTKATDIKVLNGGAAKGSAGVAGEALKKDGYTKVSVGNTTGNYTGTIIYFATGLDQEAATLKTALQKTYPKAETKAALSDNKETTGAPLTVILGKE